MSKRKLPFRIRRYPSTKTYADGTKPWVFVLVDSRTDKIESRLLGKGIIAPAYLRKRQANLNSAYVLEQVLA